MVTMMRARLTPSREPAMPWRQWVARYFSSYTTSSFADRQIAFWEWISAITRDGDESRPRAFVGCWPRGGGKSTTVELGCSYIGSQPYPSRHYVLYVSETQEQADKHVTAIGTMLERAGVERAVNQYGSSKGWRRTELRAANGFNVTAMGLDSAMRGIKLDEFRPDLIVFDDIDGRHDTPARVSKKIQAITSTILPAGSPNLAVVVVQNMIHEYGIMAQLVNGSADFLHNRLPVSIEPAVIDLQYERSLRADGTTEYKVTGGTPTWTGQSLSVVENQINDWGLAAFLSEAQHDVRAQEGGMFKRYWWRYWQHPGQHLPPVLVNVPDGESFHVNAVEIPTVFETTAQSWDLTFKGERKNAQQQRARNQSQTSYTVGLVGGRYRANTFLLDIYRERVPFTGALRAVRRMTEKWPRVAAKLIEDKANGPAVMDVLRDEISGIIPVEVEGSKEARASAATPRVEAGNYYLPHPLIADWVDDFIRELATFPGPGHNDQVDAFSQLDRYLYGGYQIGPISDELADIITAEYGGYTS